MQKTGIFMGGGEVGKLTKQRLEENGITVKAFVVNDKDFCSTPNTVNKDAINENHNQYIIVKGFLGALRMTEKEVKEIFPNCVGVFSVSEIYDSIEKISGEFWEKNKSSFKKVEDILEDEMSKLSLNAYLQAKVDEDAELLYPYIITPQYFFSDQPWNVYDNEILIDCGAFTGDSIADFIVLTHGKYEKIYAFEPDPKNMELLKEYCKRESLKNVEFIEKGLSDCENILKFDDRNDMLSVFSGDGNVNVGVTSIDRYLQGKRVSIIKMDIEGFEMDALKGAKETLTEYRPLLYISAYHKARDIFEIVDFVETLDLDYKWFFRLHKPLAVDAVLYGIPAERVK